MQREREYIEWLAARAVLEGDAQHDDPWATFMAERKKARLHKIIEQRKAAAPRTWAAIQVPE